MKAIKDSPYGVLALTHAKLLVVSQWAIFGYLEYTLCSSEWNTYSNLLSQKSED